MKRGDIKRAIRIVEELDRLDDIIPEVESALIIIQIGRSAYRLDDIIDEDVAIETLDKVFDALADRQTALETELAEI